MLIFFTLIAISAALAISYIRYHYSYWTRNGFPQDVNTKIPMGCLSDVAKRNKSPGICVYDVYNNSKEPFLGIYLTYRPALLIRDLDLVRQILINDFLQFHDRGVFNGGEEFPIYSNLFSQEGKHWKNMRIKLTPSFSSGKLKAMFSFSNDVATRMIQYLNTQLPEKETKEIDLKKVFATYAIDIIGSVIFGLDVNSFDDPNNKFRFLADDTTHRSLKNEIIGATLFFMPHLFKYVIKMGWDNQALYMLRDIIQDTILTREKHGITRKDVLQSLMQLRSHDEISADDKWSADSNSSNTGSIHLSMDNIAAHSFIFYIAGQETTSATASFTLAEFAMNPRVLHKAQEEVDEVMAKFDHTISYEALKEMKYLELCIQETLRKYPGLPTLNRQCTADYPIPGTNNIIKKGTPIIISLLGLHHDPDHFPEPKEYIPERFLETDSRYNANAYMPFGEGPRICIAARMGKINAKLAVARILQSFNIETMPKREFEIEPQAVALLAKGGVLVRMSRR